MNEESCSPWKVGKLQDVLELNESGVWGESGTQTDFPVLRSTNIQNGKLVLDDVALRKVKNPEKFMLKDGDILITKSSGSPNLIGKCGIFHHPNDSKEYLFSNFVQRIRVNKLMLPEFLYYFLNSDWGKRNLSRLHETTSGLRNLDMNRYVKQEIPIPELEIQRIITSILRKIHDIRQKREQANEMTNKILQAVFLQMFGDPTKNERKWAVKSLEETTDKITDGKHGDCRDQSNSGYYFISVKDISNGKIEYSNARQIMENDFLEVHKRTDLDLEDVLISNSGTIGKIAVVTDKERVKRTTFQKSVAIIKNRKRILNSYFLQYLLELTKDYLIKQSSGSSQKNLLLRDIKNFKIMLPPIELQNQFASFVKNTETIKELQSESAQKIQGLSNSLMTKAFRGELVTEVHAVAQSIE